MLKKSFLLSIFMSFVISNNALAQYTSSPAARNLINSFYEAESALQIGVTKEEYRQYAIKIRNHLNAFFRTSDYRKHPLGGTLLEIAESFIEINEIEKPPSFVTDQRITEELQQLNNQANQIFISIAQNKLNMLQLCLQNINLSSCYSIPELEERNQNMSQKRENSNCSERESMSLSLQCTINP